MNEMSQRSNESALDRVLIPSNGILRFSRCQLCNSPHRADVEKLYEDNILDKEPKVIFNEIVAYLDLAGAKISKICIKNHFDNHYKEILKEAAILDYKEKLNHGIIAVNNIMNNSEAIKMICLQEATDALITPAETWEDKQKKAGIITQYFSQITDIDKFIQTLCTSEAKHQAKIEKICLAIQDKLAEPQVKDEERSLYIGILQTIKQITSNP